MGTIDLERLFGSDGELEQVPSRHPLRTSGCPPTPKFYQGVRGGWSAEERRHVSHCDFCQRATALEWRIECPGLFTLVRYLAEEDAFEDLQAMRRHLETDGCRRCALALRTTFVKALAAMLRGKKRGIEEVRALAEQAVLTYTRFPRLAFDGAQFEPLESTERFEVSAEGETGTNLTLCEGDSGQLEVSVEAAAEVSQTHVEVIGDGGTRFLSLSLQRAGERSAGAHSLGQWTQQVRELGEDCLVLAAPVLENTD